MNRLRKVFTHPYYSTMFPCSVKIRALPERSSGWGRRSPSKHSERSAAESKNACGPLGALRLHCLPLRVPRVPPNSTTPVGGVHFIWANSPS
jgi:hypothetical protein